MNYRRRLKLGALLGLVAAALVGAAITHDNIGGPVLLLYPAGLIVGLLIAHLTATPKVGRRASASGTLEDYFKVTRDR